MTHTCTVDDQIVACTTCAYRAVWTTRGLFVTVPGDAEAHHTAGIVLNRAMVERIQLLIPWIKWMKEAGLA
jgi:hypothetical protein